MLHNSIGDWVMVRPCKDIKRVPVSIRLRQEIVNVSKEIPSFRAKLEARAEELYLEFVGDANE